MTVPRKGGRPLRSVPAVKRIINLSAPLSAEVDLLLYDPRLGTIAYGAFSGLIESLLREWVEQQRTPTSTETSPKE